MNEITCKSAFPFQWKDLISAISGWLCNVSWLLQLTASQTHPELHPRPPMQVAFGTYSGAVELFLHLFPSVYVFVRLLYSSSPSCLGLLPLLDHLVRRLLHTALQTNCTAPHTDSTNSHTNCANHGALCAQTNNTKHTAPGTYNFLYGTIRARFIPYTLLHSLRVNTLTLEGLYRQALFLQRVTWQDWPPHR